MNDLDRYRSQLDEIYHRARKIDVETLTPRQRHLYRVSMDAARRCFAVLEKYQPTLLKRASRALCEASEAFWSICFPNNMQTHRDPNKEYASTVIDGKTVFLEDFLMQPKEDEMVIHLNGNTLDNRRANLKVVKKPWLN